MICSKWHLSADEEIQSRRKSVDIGTRTNVLSITVGLGRHKSMRACDIEHSVMRHKGLVHLFFTHSNDCSEVNELVITTTKNNIGGLDITVCSNITVYDVLSV